MHALICNNKKSIFEKNLTTSQTVGRSSSLTTKENKRNKNKNKKGYVLSSHTSFLENDYRTF